MKHWDNLLLILTGASWGMWEILKNVSELCKELLPITGILSFIIYLIINISKIISEIEKLIHRIKVVLLLEKKIHTIDNIKDQIKDIENEKLNTDTE